jgi:hypothetical protein
MNHLNQENIVNINAIGSFEREGILIFVLDIRNN